MGGPIHERTSNSVSKRILSHSNIGVLVRERVDVEVVAALQHVLAGPGRVNAGSRPESRCQGDAAPNAVGREDGYQRLAVAVDIALDAVKMMVFLRDGTEFGEPFDEGEVFGEVVVVREERLSGGLGNAEYQAYLPDTIT